VKAVGAPTERDFMAEELRDAWRLFLLEWEAAKHYHLPYALIIGRTFRNPLVEHLLPALLLVKGVSILDEALEQVIEVQALEMPRNYRKNLEGRISFLANRGALNNADELHRVRRTRNDVAHDPDARIDWLGLESAIREIEHALTALALVGKRPKLEYFGERSAMAEAPDGRGGRAPLRSVCARMASPPTRLPGESALSLRNRPVTRASSCPPPDRWPTSPRKGQSLPSFHCGDIPCSNTRC